VSLCADAQLTAQADRELGRRLVRAVHAGLLVATHDSTMVDRMRRRVLELDKGRVVRDEIGGRYAQTDMSTAEFGALLREPAPEPRRGGALADDYDDFDDAFRD
jgi:ABC-type sulfate/molybdate transport systems ATPase subunit